MIKRNLKEYAITHFPDNPWLRKKATEWIIADLQKYLITPDEVTNCELHPELKAEVIQRQKNKWPKKYQTIANFANKMLENISCYDGIEDKTPIFTDMVFCFFAYGFLPDEYVFFYLEGTNEEHRRSYVSEIDRLVFTFRVNDFAEKDLLVDKYVAYQMLHEFYGREAICIEFAKDYTQFCEFVNAHPVFVKKLVGEGRGKSIELIETRQETDLRALFNKLIHDGRTILEERINQAKELAVFNPSSVNTVRIVTMKTRDGIIIPYTFLKNGREGSFVDNGALGGILIGIDPATGILFSNGFDETGSEFQMHPDSGVTYIGYQLPDWESARQLCMRAAKDIKGMQYISWDAAYTDKGWVIVEGNKAGQMVAQQMTIQHGIKAELEELLKKMDVIC